MTVTGNWLYVETEARRKARIELQGVDAKLSARAEKTSFCHSEVICDFLTSGYHVHFTSMEFQSRQIR